MPASWPRIVVVAVGLILLLRVLLRAPLGSSNCSVFHALVVVVALHDDDGDAGVGVVEPSESERSSVRCYKVWHILCIGAFFFIFLSPHLSLPLYFLSFHYTSVLSVEGGGRLLGHVLEPCPSFLSQLFLGHTSAAGCSLGLSCSNIVHVVPRPLPPHHQRSRY